MTQRHSNRQATPSGGSGNFTWFVILLAVGALSAAAFITRPWTWGQKPADPQQSAAAGDEGTKACCLKQPDRFGFSEQGGPVGMVWIPGGTFTMGDSQGNGF